MICDVYSYILHLYDVLCDDVWSVVFRSQDAEVLYHAVGAVEPINETLCALQQLRYLLSIHGNYLLDDPLGGFRGFMEILLQITKRYA